MHTARTKDKLHWSHKLRLGGDNKIGPVLYRNGWARTSVVVEVKTRQRDSGVIYEATVDHRRSHSPQFIASPLLTSEIFTDHFSPCYHRHTSTFIQHLSLYNPKMFSRNNLHSFLNVNITHITTMATSKTTNGTTWVMTTNQLGPGQWFVAAVPWNLSRHIRHTEF